MVPEQTRYKNMKMGDKISVLRDDSQEPPAASMNTRLVAGALTAGIEPLEKGFFSDTVEMVNDAPKRNVTWVVKGDATAHFSPDFEEESIDFVEFQKRWNSLEWQIANPSHPISYMAEMFRKHSAMVDKIKKMEPMMIIRKNGRTAIVPSGNSPEDVAKRDEILAKF